MSTRLILNLSTAQRLNPSYRIFSTIENSPYIGIKPYLMRHHHRCDPCRDMQEVDWILFLIQGFLLPILQKLEPKRRQQYKPILHLYGEKQNHNAEI